MNGIDRGPLNNMHRSILLAILYIFGVNFLDMACRYVREGRLTREQAVQLIRDNDYLLDPLAKDDFCRTLEISPAHFDEVVENHANYNLLYRDSNNALKRIDFK